MKKITSAILSACLLLSLVGCQKPVTSGSEPDVIATGPADIPAVITMDVPFTAVSVPSVTESAVADDGTVIFTKSYQSIALTLSGQAAADQIVLDFLNRVDTACANADSISDAAKSAYSGSENWIPFTCSVKFNPTRIDQGVLSLFGNSVSYTGGSHPDYSCVAANYNLITGESLTLGSILTHVDAVDKLCRLVIEELDGQAQEKNLRSGYEDQIKQRFAGEESYDDDWYFSESGLCFYFAPYEIAPYSSGVIIAEVPYDKLVDIIADEFFPPERQNLTGTVSFRTFDSETTQYAHISELIFDNEGQMYALQADSCVQDIRLIVTNAETGDSYTAYAALYLNPNDAIIIQCDADALSTMQVQYQSGDQIVTLPLTA